MQGDEEIGWDPTSIHPAPSTALKIYMLFSLVAILVAILRMVALWSAAPPFRLSRQANNAAYLKQLQVIRGSLKQWMGCILLGGGFVASTNFYQACNRLLAAKALGSTLILLVVRDSFTGLSLAIVVALFLFLARWHLHNRIQYFGK